MKNCVYYKLLNEFVMKYKQLSQYRQNAAFTMDNAKFDFVCRKQRALIRKYSKKFKLLGEK